LGTVRLRTIRPRTVVWASNYLLKLHSLQNLFAFGPICRLSTDQMYKEANILKLDQICTFQTSEFMFKNHCSLLPNTFFDYFTTVSSINPYLLRNSNNYRPVACHTNIRKFSIKYTGPSICNSLPPYLTQTTSNLLFKSRPKQYLFTNVMVIS